MIEIVTAQDLEALRGVQKAMGDIQQAITHDINNLFAQVKQLHDRTLEIDRQMRELAEKSGYDVRDLRLTVSTISNIVTDLLSQRLPAPVIKPYTDFRGTEALKTPKKKSKRRK